MMTSVMFVVCYINQWSSYSALCFVAEHKQLIQSLTWAKGKQNKGLLLSSHHSHPAMNTKMAYMHVDGNQWALHRQSDECVAW